MDKIQIPKPVGITIAVAIALLMGSGLWNKINPPMISKEFMAQDAERMKREEGDAEKLKDGGGPRTPEDAARIKFYSDKAYQPER